MHSKTKWLIKVGTVGLMLAMSVAPLAAQRIEIPVYRFASPEMDTARDLLNSGVDLYDSGKFSEAEKKFREVVEKYKKNIVADKSDYYLIRALSSQGKIQDALAEISRFEKEYARSAWLSAVREQRVKLTNQVPAEYMSRVAPVAQPPQPAQPAQQPSPQAPTPAVAPRAVFAGPQGRGAIGFGPGRTPRADENPELSLQQEVMRVLFENSPDRAIEIATERLKADPSDPVVLSSLHMIANSKSDRALPMLITLAKTSPNPTTRRDALMWISRSRGEKDAIADLLIGLLPSMTADEDSAALAFALGQMNTPKAFDALGTMARDKNKSDKLRMNAIQAIGDARLTNRVTLLDEIYKANMDNPKIRRQVVNFLTHGKDPQVVDVLGRIALNDPDIAVRRDAVIFLGQVKSPEALKALENILNKKP